MDYLIFQLQAPISAWGETAVGEFRPSANYPSHSALTGLLAAALGVRREDESAHMALRSGYAIAVGVINSGHLLRDYHTAQVPGRVALKNRPHRTRRDELNLPKAELNTILSTRDYRQDAYSLVALQMRQGAPYSLQELAAAIVAPRFVLYFGRKSCPPSAPLNPLILRGDNALEAFKQYMAHLANIDEMTKESTLERLAWGEGIDSGCSVDLSVSRKDRLLSRRGWQYGDRTEHIALMGGR